MTQNNQQIAGQTYSFAYSYNRSGALLSETYPSGRSVNTTYDTVNRPSGIGGILNGQTKSYVSVASYFPHGVPFKYTYQNQLTRTNWSFNSRLQLTAFWDALYDNPNQFLYTDNPHWGDTNNNGNLQGEDFQEGGPGPAQNLIGFSRTYSYDGVNRLTGASESSNNCGGTCWSRGFNYDAWGNMSASVNGNAYDGANRIVGQAYDAAGNQTTVNGDAVAYDAENRMISATDLPALGGGTENYFYDGEGRRVEKSGPGGTTVYVYDALGQLAAEYSTAANNASCSTCYLSYDQLGSVRMVTDQNGNVIVRHDYMPFGDEIAGGTAGRNAQWGASDSVSQRFTGKERDPETGLDFFQARYFNGAFGRFTSPDDPFAGQDASDPQSWNLYSYGSNNPLRYTDPDGHDDEDSSNGVPTFRGTGIGYSGLSPLDELLYRSLFESVFRIAIIPTQMQQTMQQSFDWLGRPRNSTCLSASTAAGASAGAAVGMAGAVGGPAVAVTEPTAMAVGGAAGWLTGMVSCMSGSGTGGGTNAGNGISESKVRFGNNSNQEYHTFRHVEEAGIDKQAAERAIRSDLAGSESTLPQGLTTRQVTVAGRTLRYNAFKLADGTINVGRIMVH